MHEAGAARARLSVLEANARAIDLYRRLGWIESHAFQDRRSGVWNFVMRKDLSG